MKLLKDSTKHECHMCSSDSMRFLCVQVILAGFEFQNPTILKFLHWGMASFLDIADFAVLKVNIFDKSQILSLWSLEYIGKC